MKNAKNLLVIVTAMFLVVLFSGCTTTDQTSTGLTGDIVIVGRDTSSGTRGAFDELVLDKLDPTVDMEQLNSNGAVRDKVASTDNAIGYVGLGYLNDDVKALKINGIYPNSSSVIDLSYPIARDLNMFTDGAATGLAADFIAFILSTEGQQIVADEGFVALTETVAADVDTTLSGTLVVKGSTTVEPIAVAAADAYMDINAGADIQISGGGSTTGVTGVGEGTADIGMASRELKDSEIALYPTLDKIVVAKDGIAIIVNPENSLEGAPKMLVKSIYLGTIGTWEDMYTATDFTRSIVIVGRDTSSGTRGAFDELVLDKEDPTVDMEQLNSNGAVRDKVASTIGAIGYVGLGYVSADVKPLMISGVLPSKDAVINDEYPIARDLNMFTDGAATGLAADFIAFILSDEGQTLVADEGFIDLEGTGPANVNTTLSGTLVVKGSTTVEPIAVAAADAYMDINVGADIQISGGGSTTGVTGVGEGTADVGMASRELKDSEIALYPTLIKNVVAKDAIALIVHPDNPVDDLTIEEIASIYLGLTPTWEDVLTYNFGEPSSIPLEMALAPIIKKECIEI